MTNPTLTYGHGHLDDCINAAAATWVESDDTLAATLTVVNDEIFMITGTCDNVADEYVIYTKDITNLDSNVYTKYLIKYKTSASASPGLYASVILDFTVGTQSLGGGFSSTWTYLSGTVTAGKTIDKILIYAVDDPDTLAAGTFQVYYDFILLYKDDFTFPFVRPGGVNLDVKNNYVDMEIANKTGGTQQYMGMDAPKITIQGETDTASGWGTPDLINVFKLFYEAHKDKWQWFSTGGVADSDRLINCKVIPIRLQLGLISEIDAPRTYKADLEMYSLSSGSESIWGLAEWLGI